MKDEDEDEKSLAIAPNNWLYDWPRKLDSPASFNR